MTAFEVIRCPDCGYEFEYPTMIMQLYDVICEIRELIESLIKNGEVKK